MSCQAHSLFAGCVDDVPKTRIWHQTLRRPAPPPLHGMVERLGTGFSTPAQTLYITARLQFDGSGG